MKCRNCGYEYNENTKNCPFCGANTENNSSKDELQIIRCPICHTQLNSEDQVCPFCGTTVDKNPSFCENCGQPLEHSSAYCSFCGHPVTSPKKLEIETKVNIISEIDFNKKKKTSIIGIITYFGVFYFLAPIFSQIIMAIILKNSQVDLELINSTEDLMRLYPNIYALILAFTNLCSYGLLFASVFVILFKMFRDDLIIFKTNISTFWKNFGVTFGLLYLANFASNIVLSLILAFCGLSSFDGGTSENQAAIDLMLTASPTTMIITFLMTIIAAPIIEELVFRKAFFNLSKEKGKKTIIISGFIFGAIHIVDAVLSGLLAFAEGTGAIQEVIVEFLYIISYASSGIVLGYCYKKSNYNIIPNIAAHMAYNAVGVILTLLLSLF